MTATIDHSVAELLPRSDALGNSYTVRCTCGSIAGPIFTTVDLLNTFGLHCIRATWDHVLELDNAGTDADHAVDRIDVRRNWRAVLRHLLGRDKAPQTGPSPVGRHYTATFQG